MAGVLDSTVNGAAAGSSMGPYGALIGGGLGAVSGIMSAGAAEDAARAQAEREKQALAISQGVYGTAQKNLQPFQTTGVGASARLGGLLANQVQPGFGYKEDPFSFDKYKDPGAAVIMQQAAQAINNSALVHGGVGGGLGRALSTEIGNEANQAYQGSFQRNMDTNKFHFGQAQGAYDRNATFQQNQIGNNQVAANSGQNAAEAITGAGNDYAKNATGILGSLGGTEATGIAGNSAGQQSAVSSIGGGIQQALSMAAANQNQAAARQRAGMV